MTVIAKISMILISTVHLDLICLNKIDQISVSSDNAVDKTEVFNTKRVQENQLNISKERQAFFQVPEFKGRKLKKRKSPQTKIVATVNDLLTDLQQKEDTKKLKEKQVLEKKQKQQQTKILREKQGNIIKTFQEKSKKLTQDKKEIILEIKKLKVLIKSSNSKENKAEFENQLQVLEARLDNTEQLIATEKLSAIQCKIKIKQEKFDE